MVNLLHRIISLHNYDRNFEATNFKKKLESVIKNQHFDKRFALKQCKSVFKLLAKRCSS